MRCKHFERRREQFQGLSWSDIEAFFDKAYLALLPVAMSQQGWQLDGSVVNTSEQRAALARRWAHIALTERYEPLQELRRIAVERAKEGA